MSDQSLRIEDLDRDALLRHIDNLHRSIHTIAHDLSNPLGILRMAVYVLQTAKPDEGKRDEYYTTMNTSIDRLDGHIKRLRRLTEAFERGESSGGTAL